MVMVLRICFMGHISTGGELRMGRKISSQLHHPRAPVHYLPDVAKFAATCAFR